MAWITGAAGGLGRGLVAAFSSRNWRVAAAYHRQPGPGETDWVWPFALDVTNPVQVQAGCDRILDRWGRIDALVNNAGVVADQLFWRLREADWDRVVAVNLKGAWLCARAALAPMRAQTDGHIINVSSFAARHGPEGQANYAAAKAGLLGLTVALAREAGPDGVRVNAVLPGVLPTPMTATLSEKQWQGLIAANVLRRPNSMAEVAQFIAFLATMQNVSGQVFQLDSRVGRWD